MSEKILLMSDIYTTEPDVNIFGRLQRHGYHSIRRHIGRQIIKAHSPGLLITQAGHGHIGWHHGSGAHHKEAISQRDILHTQV